MFFEMLDENRLKLRSLLQADSLEKRAFIEISETTYQDQANKGFVYNIACSTEMLDDCHLGISYSLPRIVQEESIDSTLNLGYYNSPVILSRDVNTLRRDSMIPLDFNLFHDDYFYMHFSFSALNDKILMGCKKMTWPMEFEPKEYKDNPSMNPFCEEFYQTPNSFMAAFSQNDEYTLVEINRKDASIHEYRLPHYADMEVLGYGLSDQHGQIQPFVFLKKANTKEYIVRVYNSATAPEV